MSWGDAGSPTPLAHPLSEGQGYQGEVGAPWHQELLGPAGGWSLEICSGPGVCCTLGMGGPELRAVSSLVRGADTPGGTGVKDLWCQALPSRGLRGNNYQAPWT